MSNGLQVGDIIGGQYEIFDIKKGGMGIVYLTHDIHDDPQDNITPYGTALKTFQDKYLNNQSSIERFKREAIIWIKLSEIPTPEIVRADYVIQHYGKPYIVLEYVYGLTLGFWMRHHKSELEIDSILLSTCLDFSIQICHGMDYAQRRIPGIVHRDLKPENIIIKEPPQGYSFGDDRISPRITDFGLVKVLEENDEFLVSLKNQENSLTETGWGFGDYLYRSPEQSIDAKSVTPTSDLYSFGIVLFEMLTVGTQYRTSRWYDFMRGVVKELPDNRRFCPNKFNYSIPKNLNNLIMKCLEKYPDRRFTSFGELLSELNRVKKLNNIYTNGLEISTIAKDDLRAIFDRGLSYANLGELDQALACFDKAIQMAPEFVEAWANKGNCLIALGQFDEAMKVLNKALEFDSRHPIVLMYKGNYFHAIGETEKAIEFYDKALENVTDFKTTPELIDALVYKAGILSNVGTMSQDFHNLEEAIDLLDKALEIDPFHARALLFKGITLVAYGDYQAAIPLFQSSINSDSQNEQAYYEIGRCYGILKNYSQAELFLKKANSINPSPETYFNLAVCAFNQGNNEMAKEYLEIALEFNPNYTRARQLLQQLRY